MDEVTKVKSVAIVMPAYNAEKTLENTWQTIPSSFRSNVILVDDFSTDGTLDVAHALGIKTIKRGVNGGYGANQKDCYDAALAEKFEIVIMLHPDNQYDPRVIPLLAEIIHLGICDVVLGNRIRTRDEALKGGMPLWKYLINRVSTFGENFILGQSIGDFHSGLRAYSAEVLRTIPYHQNSDDFAFDQEFLVQSVHFGFKIGDIPVPVRYFKEASSINFRRSLKYGLGGLNAILCRFLHTWHLKQDSRFIERVVNVP
jgi:glycosyltransferase involved in cell wall biosynthesis